MTHPKKIHGRSGQLSCLLASAGLIATLACGSEEPIAPAAPDTTAESSDVAAMTQVEETGFMFKEMPIARDSARAGDGQQVTLQGRPVVLRGTEIQVGAKLPEATLVGAGLESVSLRDGMGHVRIVSVVPALGTPVCEQQTHYLSEKNAGLEESLELVTVSLDPHEDQAAFAQEASIENVTFLSDAPGGEFGSAAGLLIEQPRILARAVMVVDAENVVRYLQVVPEVTQLPDMEAAFTFARELLESQS